jgi:hypothetical protein
MAGPGVSLLSMDVERADLVAAYWHHHRLATGQRSARLEADSWSWAWEAVEAVVHEAPLEDALVLLDALLAAQDADLAYLGAGPIEDLMNVHGALLDMPVAERCEQSPKWAEAVWGSIPPDGLEADAKRLRPYLRPDVSPADPPAKVRRKKQRRDQRSPRAE